MAHPPMGKGHHPGAHDGKRSFERVIVHKKRGHHDMRGRHGINGYPHYRRIDRGFVVPQYWWGPGHHVQNWAMYDFPQPMHGGRWVRYYDDALLIDHGGRVLDGRWGMSWDEYGDEWGYDESGIPAYVGNGDFYPGEEDYAWVEGEQGRYAEGHGHGGAYGHGAYGYPGYGYAYPWYGYGYASGGMITVTETTVTTAPTVVEKVYVKEVAYSKPRRAHKVRRQATKRCTPVCCSC
jgi:Ni/Co efflux regulator RcnB